MLEKSYVYVEEVGDFVTSRLTGIGSEIKWKDEKELTREFEQQNQK